MKLSDMSDMEQLNALTTVIEAAIQRLAGRIEHEVHAATARGQLRTTEPDLTWQQVALRVGEDLADCGPVGYYAMTPAQWQTWALTTIADGRRAVMAHSEDR